MVWHYAMQVGRRAPVSRLLKPLLEAMPLPLVKRLPTTFINDTYFSGLRVVALPGARPVFMHLDPTSESLAREGLDDHGGEALRCFIALVRPGTTFFDVGANTGIYSLLAIALGASTVHAFEPVPFIAERLRQNAALNGFRIDVHDAAVSSTSGSITIYVPRGAMPTEASTSAAFRPGSVGHEVPAITLDDFCRTSRVERLDVMKIDTESTEPAVLRGAADVLRHRRPVIVCEVLHGLTEPALHDLLDPHGYAYFHVTANGLTKVTRIVGDPGYRFLNFLFVPSEREDAIRQDVDAAFAAPGVGAAT